MKGFKKNPTQTKEPCTNANKTKQKKAIRKPKPEKSIHTQNPLNTKLYKKGQPLQRLKNQMTDKRDKKKN